VATVYLEKATSNVPGLNALRFFGATLVVLLHLGSYHWFKKWGIASYHTLFSGGTGIHLFYVISGFLITCLGIDEVRSTNDFNYPKFLQRRALRLFPLYYLAISCICLLDLFKLASVPTKGFWYALFYGYNMVPKDGYNGLLGSFHTLATEEQFYLLYGLILFATIRGIWTRKLGRHLAPTALTLILLIALAFGKSLGDKLAVILDPRHPGRLLFNAMNPILIGCIAALFVKSAIAEKLSRLLVRNAPIALAIHFGLLFLFAYFYWGYAFFHHTVNLLSVGFACLLIDFYYFRDSAIVKVLDHPCLVYLGKISYGIYVWQAVINGTGSNSRWIRSPWLSTALVFFLSVISYELYEKRFLRMKRY
jgi:peptidoglycan/LPS O-acetylase OafA/YrhL